jgi:CO dehydrogenase/acetyl-CoA synthase delta subunit
MSNNLSVVEKKVLTEVLEDPVKWAQIFVKAYDPVGKRTVPWVARWYQVEMLRDKSVKKVARCGRRTGKQFCPYAVNCGKDTGKSLS